MEAPKFKEIPRFVADKALHIGRFVLHELEIRGWSELDKKPEIKPANIEIVSSWTEEEWADVEG
jgi:hypothetical protein